ncbi:AtpZ/AtpI family protein [Candidatus Endowatersipora endosymbiont of Watersipora subatra]|uniref:AtpZ/AtpI family protein n=1 Tax=Candidatus Endowatersipora endosymbiont of Watersipora subatra TaxID=3077946 RepID=UPI00312CB644
MVISRCVYRMEMNSNHSNKKNSADDKERLDRLKTLKENLRVKEEDYNSQKANKEMVEIAPIIRLSSEFIASVIVGALLGYSVDYFFKTNPWGLIFFLVLGFVSSVFNIIRSTDLASK